MDPKKLNPQEAFNLVTNRLGKELPEALEGKDVEAGFEGGGIVVQPGRAINRVGYRLPQPKRSERSRWNTQFLRKIIELDSLSRQDLNELI